MSTVAWQHHQLLWASSLIGCCSLASIHADIWSLKSKISNLVIGAQCVCELFRRLTTGSVVFTTAIPQGNTGSGEFEKLPIFALRIGQALIKSGWLPDNLWTKSCSRKLWATSVAFHVSAFQKHLSSLLLTGPMTEGVLAGWWESPSSLPLEASSAVWTQHGDASSHETSCCGL